MPSRRVLILTNCTNRKRGLVPHGLCARSLPKATYKGVSAEWAKRLDQATEHYVADKLYCGRAVTETLQAASMLSAEVVFVSAGLGVVPQSEKVPAYNLTSSPGLPDSIASRIEEQYSSVRWWQELNNARGRSNALVRLLRKREPDLVLAALPTSYLAMVGEEFNGLPTELQKTLRIIGPRRMADVPDKLRAYWLPYDWRLDNEKSGYNGTTADFPHRALRHFVTELPETALSLPVARHQALVEDTLARFKPYMRKQGMTVSDEEVLALIDRLWKKHNGHRARMLRHLRDHTPIACEQRRFKRLADQYRERL